MGFQIPCISKLFCFPIFGFERTCMKRVVRTKLDIYVFISISVICSFFGGTFIVNIYYNLNSMCHSIWPYSVLPTKIRKFEETKGMHRSCKPNTRGLLNNCNHRRSNLQFVHDNSRFVHSYLFTIGSPEFTQPNHTHIHGVLF